MDHPLIDLINARIKAAEEAGAFDNLPGAGQPLPAVDEPENALLNRIVRENGGVPEYVLLARQAAELRAHLRETTDRSARRKILQELSLMDARLEAARKAWAR